MTLAGPDAPTILRDQEAVDRAIAERNAAAVDRARAERHVARLDGSSLVVVSHTSPDLAYRVGVGVDLRDGVTFTCTPVDRRTRIPQPERTHMVRHSEVHGQVTCKHAARAALRLEREGVLRLDSRGRWVLTRRVRAAVAVARRRHERRVAEGTALVADVRDSDPFAGLAD